MKAYVVCFELVQSMNYHRYTEHRFQLDPALMTSPQSVWARSSCTRADSEFKLVPTKKAYHAQSARLVLDIVSCLDISCISRRGQTKLR